MLRRLQRLELRAIRPPVHAKGQPGLDQFETGEHARDLGTGTKPSTAQWAVHENLLESFGDFGVFVLRIEEVAERDVGARRQGVDLFGHDARRSALTIIVVQCSEMKERDRLGEIEVLAHDLVA